MKQQDKNKQTWGGNAQTQHQQPSMGNKQPWGGSQANTQQKPPLSAQGKPGANLGNNRPGQNIGGKPTMNSGFTKKDDRNKGHL
jgi:hypothetical protein